MEEKISNQIIIKLRRAQKGLTVTIRTAPEIEDLIRSWGEGDPSDIKLYGRHWTPLEEGTALLVYPIEKSPGPLQHEKGVYRLDTPGCPLWTPPNQVNLSFLRLVGISSGVAFRVAGVFETDQLRDLEEHIKFAVKRFYVAFMKPVTLTLTLMTKEEAL